MMLTDDDIRGLCGRFGIRWEGQSRLIDSSRSDEDIRWNIVLDGRWVLRVNTPGIMTESRLAGIARLIDRYRSIGLVCPRYIPSAAGPFLIPWGEHVCYLSEYADLPLAEETALDDEAAFQREVAEHLGRLAARFTGVDLMPVRSMWSIIELAPLDVDMDEKQENLLTLTAKLREIGEAGLAREAEDADKRHREAIAPLMPRLPSCVYQGDLNWSNLLVRDGHFAGLIDFNMSGTEVNVNCFLNETDALETSWLKTMPGAEVYRRMLEEQDDKMALILRHYSLNEDERRVLEHYRAIIMLCQYPHVVWFCRLLEDPRRRAEILTLLRLIIAHPA